MPKRRPTTVACPGIMSRGAASLMIASCALACGGRESARGPSDSRPPTTVTFNRDVAPIVHTHCATCHRPVDPNASASDPICIAGAPFPLLEYRDARAHAAEIAGATARRVMPPWLPERGYGSFSSARGLTDDQIAIIQRWAEQGAIEGDPREKPALPTWPDGWQLGEPDLVVQMPETFTLPEFIATLNAWTSDKDHEPGKQMIYSRSGFMLIHLALERRLGLPFDQLMTQRLLKPLGLRSTTLPMVSANPMLNPRGEIPKALARHAVQGYSEDGTPIGAPANLQGYYHWLGTGQMYATARDMAVFLAATILIVPNSVRMARPFDVGRA